MCSRLLKWESAANTRTPTVLLAAAAAAALNLQCSLREKEHEKKRKIPPTFTHSNFGDRDSSCRVKRGARQPQCAVAVRPVLPAAGLPLQPRALLAASARVPGQRPATLAAVLRLVHETRTEVTRRALVSRERTHQKQDVHEHNGTLAEHV